MYKLFSERKQEANGEISDVYKYLDFPISFRNQVFDILANLFEINEDTYCCYLGESDEERLWNRICETYAHEKGIKSIHKDYYSDNDRDAFEHYSDHCKNEDYLDLLDYVFTEWVDRTEVSQTFGRCKVQAAIDELNYRLKQHSLGYEFIDGHLIEKTNEQIHREIIKPAIHLLAGKDFEGANEEYFAAFDCFKQGDNKGAILNAGKAFESTLKVICAKMKYTLEKGEDTAKKLIEVLKKNNFFPAYLSEHLNAICTSLENGAPTVRNKTAGHGQGEQVQEVSEEFAEYELNLVAANIVFLVKLCNEKRKK